ncbi:recombinase family protein [Streptomyces marincola]|uniref:Recombinase family protein n=2 Tax=Streptomyces marincola TaxID=2878388 RepID=A0A1W7D4U0_9ACTN|nr:recombinase family protein [Streptomyces marincola]
MLCAARPGGRGEWSLAGRGKRLLGVRRLSWMKAATTSPERQRENVLSAAAAAGGVIGWADDWEVSGATDFVTRPSLGPWLRGERGPFDGLVAAAVDRLGRNVVDCLNTGYRMRDEGRLLVTYGHDGPWDLSDSVDENRFTMEAWGAQVELRAIQRRDRDATEKMRRVGRPKGKPSYGFRFIRAAVGGRIERVELHPHAAEVLRNVARRIIADPELVTPSSEAARLNRLGEPSPADHLAVMYGRQTRGRPWYPTSLRNMLLSEAALGYLMHRNRPVLDRSGRPVSLCECLWDRATHQELKRVLTPRDTPFVGRRSTRDYMLTEVALCGNCHNRLFTQTSADAPRRYGCTARNKGWISARNCRPAPLIRAQLLDTLVEEWFLRTFGDGVIYETVYDSGNGVRERIAEMRANRERLRADRQSGLYDASDDAEWFRQQYTEMGQELKTLEAEPERAPGLVQRPTGETVADRWVKAMDDQERKEILLDFGMEYVLREERMSVFLDGCSWEGFHSPEGQRTSMRRSSALVFDKTSIEAAMAAQVSCGSLAELFGRTVVTPRGDAPRLVIRLFFRLAVNQEIGLFFFASRGMDVHPFRGIRVVCNGVGGFSYS